MLRSWASAFIAVVECVWPKSPPRAVVFRLGRAPLRPSESRGPLWRSRTFVLVIDVADEKGSGFLVRGRRTLCALRGSVLSFTPQCRQSRHCRVKACPSSVNHICPLNPPVGEESDKVCADAPLYDGGCAAGSLLLMLMRLCFGLRVVTCGEHYRIVFYQRGSVAAWRGLRPCLLCHLCPSAESADAGPASGPKRHRLTVVMSAWELCEE